MKRVTRILGTSDRHQLGNGSLRTLAALTAGTVVAAAGIANAAMRASEPRYEQPEVVEDNLDSSVMLDEQAWREILLEVAVPGMINAGKLDQHVQSALLKIEDAVSKGAITAQEGEARRAALNDDVDFRLRMNFKTKVTGMTVEEAQQAIMQERREAEIKDGEIGAADDDEYTRLDLSPNGSTINGTPVRMIEGDWIYGTYEVLEDSPDGVYKAGDTFVVTEPLSGGAIQMFDGGDEREGASGDGLILPGVEEEVLEARQKQELGVFNVYKRNLASGYFQELHKELDSGHMTKDEVDERVEEALRRERFVARWLSIDLMYQDQVSAGKLSVEEANTLLSEARKANGYFDSPYGSEFTFEVVQPGKVFEITVETAPGSDAPAGQPVELDLQVEPVETQRKLTPMDEEYWHHQGIRPLSAYDDSVDGC